MRPSASAARAAAQVAFAAVSTAISTRLGSSRHCTVFTGAPPASSASFSGNKCRTRPANSASPHSVSNLDGFRTSSFALHRPTVTPNRPPPARCFPSAVKRYASRANRLT